MGFRPRIHKCDAGMPTFLETEFDSLNDNTLGLYGALTRGGGRDSLG